jgi:hypothetical protein
MADRLPCVIYAVKSSPDDKDSISTQLAQCRAAVASEGGLRALEADPFFEDNASGSRANRGPQLEAALRAVKDAAERDGEAELWVWHTSRLARGSGRKDEARALGMLLYDLRASGVTVRSVEDDDFATNEMLWGFASKQASKYADDLKAWVRRGKDRQREQGRYLGGPAPDGYHQREVRMRGDKPFRPRLVDETRAPIIRRAFELGATMGDPAVADKLNEEGHRVRSGKPWSRRQVQNMLTNPHYAGLTRDGETLRQLDGSAVPAIVATEVFEAAQAARAARDKSAAGRRRASDRKPKGGRPTTRYVLAKLGRCERCGGTMYARTSPYKRKDETQARIYVCANSRYYDRAAATCDAPKIDAEAADAAIIPHLRDYVVDYEGWIADITNAQQDERSAIEGRAADARAKLEQRKLAERAARQRYTDALAAGDDAKASVIEGALMGIANERAALEAAVEDAEATLATLEGKDAPTDAVLDWQNAVSAALRGAIDESGTVAEINARLRDVLSHVLMDTLPDGRFRLTAFFAHRTEAVPQVDANYNPTGGFDEWPVTVEIYAGHPMVPPPAVPIETGSYSHA